MGFLDKLWDETLAGPTPETGLGRFRKYNSFSAVRSKNHPMANVASQYHDDNQTAQVSRSITILRPKNISVETGSGSSTPSSGPSSPFSPGTTTESDVKRFARKKPVLDPMEHPAALSPTVYDCYKLSDTNKRLVKRVCVICRLLRTSVKSPKDYDRCFGSLNMN